MQQSVRVFSNFTRFCYLFCIFLPIWQFFAYFKLLFWRKFLAFSCKKWWSRTPYFLLCLFSSAQPGHRPLSRYVVFIYYDMVNKFHCILWVFVTQRHFCSVRLTTAMVGQTFQVASIYMELSFVCKALSFVYPTFSFVSFVSQRGQKLLGLRPWSLLPSFRHIWRLLSPRQTQISPDNAKGKAEYCYQCNKISLINSQILIIY